MPRFAAVDIGSNSIRMMVAEAGAGATRILLEERQVTRLGASVFLEGHIAEDALRFVCAQLARMSAQFLEYQVEAVRAVATSAVRDANNQREFLAETQQALGWPVEIISGEEEARLIHLGVQARWPQPESRSLLIDVGGGSTEFILSDRGEFGPAFSKPLGAVRLAEVFLRHDPPAALELHQMREYIDEKLAGPVQRIVGPFDRIVATSATAAALVCAANAVPRTRREEADRMSATTAQITEMYEQFCRLDLQARQKIAGIGPRRAELIVAGAAVYLRALLAFGMGSLSYSVAGVRDGIIADLLARGQAREKTQLSQEQRATVEEMAQRYGVQLPHARQVARMAHSLFVGLQPLHRLPAAYGFLLEAAAFLHDIGHFVSNTGHHKHSQYLVANSDLPGFTAAERNVIAALCRYHRKAAPTVRHAFFQTIEPGERQAVLALTPLLRLADSFDRGHEQRVEGLTIEVHRDHAAIGLQSRLDTDLELWAAERNADLFARLTIFPWRLFAQPVRAGADLEKALEQLQAEADRAAGSQYEEAVHGLRVSIRRFSQALILFPDLWPKGKAGQAKESAEEADGTQLRGAQPRYRAGAFGGLSTRKEIKFRLRQERSARADEFRMAVERFASGPSAAQWRGLLERRLQVKWNLRDSAAADAARTFPSSPKNTSSGRRW